MLSRLTTSIRHASARAPLVLPASAGILAILGVEGRWLPAVACLAITALCFRMQGKRGFIMSVLVAGLMAGLHFAHTSSQEKWSGILEKEQHVIFSGSVLRTIGNSVLVEGHTLSPGGSTSRKPALVRVRLRKGMAVETGNSYIFHSSWIPAKGSMNPGEFDSAAWLKRLGVSAELNALVYKKTGPGNLKSRILAASKDFNHFLQSRIDSGVDSGDQKGEVIKSLVLGARSEASAETIDPFKKSGLLHIFAVSGLHVGLVALLVSPVLFLTGLRPRGFAIVLGLILVAYDFATGLSVSANRATLMIIVFLGATAMSRQSSPINRLALAALAVMAWDTNVVFQLGFQLSFVVFAVVIASAASASVLYKKADPDPFIPESLYTRHERFRQRISRTAITACFISFAAWIAASILLVPNIHYVSPFAPVANTLLSVPVILLMGTGLLTLILGGVPGIGPLFYKLSSCLAGGILSFTQFSAGLPQAAISLAPSPGPGSISIYSLYGTAYSAAMGNPCVLLESGSEASARNIIMPALLAEGYRPALLAVSHYHKNQSDGIAYLSRNNHFHKIIGPPQKTAAGKNDLLPSSSATALKRGQHWDNGNGGRLTLIDLPESTDAILGGEDDRALVFLWEYGGRKILFLGDAGFNAEIRIRRNYPGLRADIIVLGYHRSDFSGNADFLLSLMPDWIIYTAPGSPDAPKRPSDWRTQLRNSGCRLHCMKTDGAFIWPG